MFTVEQVSQLAPDAASLKAGRDQARPAKWQQTGLSAPLAWGSIQGSGKEPYRTVVDASGLAFHCTCPSRKFPCKHSLGLMFVIAESGVATATELPDWVREWRDKRGASADRKAATARAKAEAPSGAEATPAQLAEKEAAIARRAERRDQVMSDGLEQTRVWIEDLMRQGLAWAQGQPQTFWQEQVARLVNAQLPGVARMVEDCAGAAHGGDGWAGRLLGRLTRVHLLCRAWPHRAQLDEARAADIRAAVGQPVAQEALLAQPGMAGTWQVLARVQEERDHLRSYRHWLECRQTGCVTQVFVYAAGSQTLDTSLTPGLSFEGELVFYPGLLPRRALIKRREPGAAPIAWPSTDSDLGSAMSGAAVDWAQQPWLMLQPMQFHARPRADLGGFVDDAGRFLAWKRGFTGAWNLMALSGGEPLQVFGELGDEGFAPLSAVRPGAAQAWHFRDQAR